MNAMCSDGYHLSIDELLLVCELQQQNVATICGQANLFSEVDARVLLAILYS